MSDILSKDLKFLQGVGPKKADLLCKEINVSSYRDMLYYFPYKYIDRSKYYKIADINSTLSFVQIKGEIVKVNLVGTGAKQRLTAFFSDGENLIELVWFKGVKYIADTYKPGFKCVIFGKPNEFNGKYNFVHPEVETLEEASSKQNLGGQFGLYITTERMKTGFLTSRNIQKIIMNIIKDLGSYQIVETLPAYILEKYNLMILNDALRNIHFPHDENALKQAQFRLKFEELFYIQLKILRNSQNRMRQSNGFVFSKVGSYFNDFFFQYLPFELTDAQKKVIKEIHVDLKSGKQMNRLLQGDVGSGKTLVALMVMLLALDNDFQACLMAPTEILANQHFISILEMVKPLGISVGLLTGSTKKKDRNVLLESLASGEIQILIGTHALIEDGVIFKNLGIAIIDEQHRFGVAQRAKLWAKNYCPPHVLVMTATPIPRTLAMTLYGDLDVSVIDQLPPGRKPIKTVHVYDNYKPTLYSFIKEQIEIGRQIYIVYPLIQESEKSDYKNLEEGFAQLNDVFPQPKYSLCMVHGKMKPADKDKQMQLFADGKANILVATTVIEVGVNVPNASVMVIESAERFGLSQLHQLRGRVGRGAEQSFCVLVTPYNLSSDGKARMNIMVQTNDGFVISEEDLKMRGPGMMDGTQQSGDPFELKIANLAKDGVILQNARIIAENVLAEDPDLSSEKNYVLRKYLEKGESDVNWGVIS